MGVFRRSRRLVWLTCVLLLLHTFAPGIAHARYVDPGSEPQFAICTASGSLALDANFGADDLAPVSTERAAFAKALLCPYCAAHAAAIVPATPVSMATLPVGGEIAPSSPVAAAPVVVPLFARAARPRAPPLAV